MMLFKKLVMAKFNGADGDGAGTLKLNANAHEFVPRRDKILSSNSKFPNVNAQEFVPRQMDASTQVNADTDEDLEVLEDENVSQWMEYPAFPIKVTHGSQMAMLNHTKSMIVPGQSSGQQKKKQSIQGPSSVYGEEIASITSPNESLSFGTGLLVCENRRRADQERLRKHERNVALEALKLVEQRRSRGSLVPNNNSESLGPPRPVIHLTRSPVRYTAKEWLHVGRLRYAKRERVERILREMSEERKQHEQNKDSSLSFSSSPQESLTKSPTELPPESLPKFLPGSSSESPLALPSDLPPESPPLTPLQLNSKPARRYIPTAKEWDEHRRAKAQAKREAKRKARRAAQREREAQQKGKSSSSIQDCSMEMPIEMPLQIKAGDLVAVQLPAATPRNRPPPTGNGSGNGTNWRDLANRPTQIPQKFDNGKIVLRYSTQELHQLRLQFKNLKMSCLEEKFQGMGFLYN